ncbi:hypothetical protein Tco_0960947 [Tanacetum coccineum]
MGDENPIRTLGDYSKPSHEGYRNTIELPVGNNVVLLRSDTIRLLKELTTNRTPKKVLIREEAKFPITKNVNSISLVKGEEERSNERKVTPDNTEKPTETGMKMPEKRGTRVGKKKKKAYNVLPEGPVYEAILKKKITKKEDIRGNFKIPCSIGGLKHVNALVDQGSDVNVMPYSTYMKLTDERLAETDIRLIS